MGFPRDWQGLDASPQGPDLPAFAPLFRASLSRPVRKIPGKQYLSCGALGAHFLHAVNPVFVMPAFRALSVFRPARLPSTARPRASARWLEYALQAAIVGWLCLWMMPTPVMAGEGPDGGATQPLSTDAST